MPPGQEPRHRLDWSWGFLVLGTVFTLLPCAGTLSGVPGRNSCGTGWQFSGLYDCRMEIWVWLAVDWRLLLSVTRGCAVSWYMGFLLVAASSLTGMKELRKMGTAQLCHVITWSHHMTMYFDPLALSLQASHRPTHSQDKRIIRECDNQDRSGHGPS